MYIYITELNLCEYNTQLTALLSESMNANNTFLLNFIELNHFEATVML